MTVTAADPARLRELLAGPGVTVTGAIGAQTLQVSGLSAQQIGAAATKGGIAVYQLTPETASLEQAVMD